ncbi:hypothetical protein FACS189476_02790 [Spirochaetia bacterium]|nr:hypothetical protein FACS189476_02790 [Spirochaetia bacterium]
MQKLRHITYGLRFGAKAPPGSVRLGQSLRSFPRLTPPTFCPPCKCFAFAYSGGQNVANLSRYVQWGLKFL